MGIELFNQSKYRDGSSPGDDVPLILPGMVFGVFDGATDPKGTVVDGIAAGRLAALTVAAEMAVLATDPATRLMSGDAIIGRLSNALQARTAPLDLPIPPSTTLAVALDCGDAWRFLLLGDSGLRLNGSEVHHPTKVIDAVSTAARVAVFNVLKTGNDDLDAVEMAARRCIFLGFDAAVSDGVLAPKDATAIVEDTIAVTGLASEADTISRFLTGGIQTQHLFGNASGSALCFDTMNGATPRNRELLDIVRAKSEIGSIELFTDGFPSLPDTVTAAAWEQAFQQAETTDFHKIGSFATVKGSTSTEFFDDRTVVIVT